MSTAEQFQPLHQKKQQETQFSSSVGASSLHKSMFKKPSPHQISELKNKFASPTDEMLSPCSQKLNDHRSKLFQVKSNPTKLNFQSKQLEEEF
ncbi:spo12 super family protein [Kluyveromyces marxianus]|uniref:Spo12 super family protein n=2 Tax=Kluyveromyces marxianus TaxID=4911 RepID=W0TGW7_KLUMD|nr:spo12 super family protein [Kluyveromyces marxianus DMKU3-1042]QGN17514.1 spo12 super family protein [Kluyveromyces marxianus]BAO41344.1 spo12 super family protein [Kluyveromyces marxianus DMKU3-1042]